MTKYISQEPDKKTEKKEKYLHICGYFTDFNKKKPT